MENNIDTIIYIENFNKIAAPMLDDICKEYNIEDAEKFRSMYDEELEFVCAENVLIRKEPTLDEDQFMSLLSRCIATYYLESLEASGMIQKRYDESINDTVFSLTDKGEEQAKRFGL